MSIEGQLKGLPRCFHQLFRFASGIKKGVKGVDFLVLIDDDEMKGYDETDLERGFREAVEEIEQYTSVERSGHIEHQTEMVYVILYSLVLASPAVDAYRARMYAYATDWGSEVSSVGNWSRKLQDIVDRIIKGMSTKLREKVYNSLPDEVKKKSIERIYWSENDRHDSYYRSIKSILFAE